MAKMEELKSLKINLRLNLKSLQKELAREKSLTMVASELCSHLKSEMLLAIRLINS